MRRARPSSVCAPACPIPPPQPARSDAARRLADPRSAGQAKIPDRAVAGWVPSCCGTALLLGKLTASGHRHAVPPLRGHRQPSAMSPDIPGATADPRSDPSALLAAPAQQPAQPCAPAAPRLRSIVITIRPVKHAIPVVTAAIQAYDHAHVALLRHDRPCAPSAAFHAREPLGSRATRLSRQSAPS